MLWETRMGVFPITGRLFKKHQESKAASSGTGKIKVYGNSILMVDHIGLFGGDFGEERHDVNFCINGIIYPDLSPKPALRDIAHCYAPINITILDASRGLIRITNQYDFSTLSHLTLDWQIAVDGEVRQQGQVSLWDTFPGMSEELSLPIRVPQIHAGQETTLTIFITQREATDWCEAGHLMMHAQAMLPRSYPIRAATDTVTGTVVVQQQHPLTIHDVSDIRVGDAIHSFDQTDLHIALHQEPLLLSGPHLALARAATDNDGIKSWTGQEQKPLGHWQALGLFDLSISTARGDLMYKNM